MNDSFVPQPSEERWRPDFDVPLDNLPQDDIYPARLATAKGEHRFAGWEPKRADELTNNLTRWIKATLRRTIDKNKEHAFYVDYYGNVMGILEGDRSFISMPPDSDRNIRNIIHTHPPRDRIAALRVSTGDLESIINSYRSTAYSGTTVLTGFDDSLISIFTVYLFRSSDPKLYLGSTPESRTDVKSAFIEHANKFYRLSDKDIDGESALEENLAIESYMDQLENITRRREIIGEPEESFNVVVSMDILQS